MTVINGNIELSRNNNSGQSSIFLFEIKEEKNKTIAKCNYCPSTDTVEIKPKISIEVRYSYVYEAWTYKEEFRERIEKIINKVYENRFCCENEKCKLHFVNETYIKFSRKSQFLRISK